jgi:hypothetical protein
LGEGKDLLKHPKYGELANYLGQSRMGSLIQNSFLVSMGLSTHQLRNHFLQGIWLIGKSHLPTSTLLRGVDVS